MGKVRLEIPPFMASMMNGQCSDWLTIDKEIEEGAKIGDLLVDLAFSYTNFRKVVFDPDIGEVSDQILIILNNSPLQDSNMTEVKLNDGDSIVILPVYAGG